MLKNLDSRGWLGMDTRLDLFFYLEKQSQRKYALLAKNMVSWTPSKT